MNLYCILMSYLGTLWSSFWKAWSCPQTHQFSPCSFTMWHQHFVWHHCVSCRDGAFPLWETHWWRNSIKSKETDYAILIGWHVFTFLGVWKEQQWSSLVPLRVLGRLWQDCMGRIKPLCNSNKLFWSWRWDCSTGLCTISLERNWNQRNVRDSRAEKKDYYTQNQYLLLVHIWDSLGYSCDNNSKNGVIINMLYSDQPNTKSSRRF